MDLAGLLVELVDECEVNDDDVQKSVHQTAGRD